MSAAIDYLALAKEVTGALLSADIGTSYDEINSVSLITIAYALIAIAEEMRENNERQS